MRDKRKQQRSKAQITLSSDDLNLSDVELGQLARKILAAALADKERKHLDGIKKIIDKSKSIPVEVNGVIYFSKNEASRQTGLSIATIRKIAKDVV